MLENILEALPYLVLISHVVFGILFLAIISRRSWGSKVQYFLGKNAVLGAFLISLVAVLGSLFYSELMGFEPCVLCWWQRIFLYPLLIIFGMAIWKRLPGAFLYAIPLTILAGLIALYHAYAPKILGSSLLPCLAEGGDCFKVYVSAFGYITIPVMSLTVVAYILLLAWAHRLYRNENSNS